MPHSQSWLWWKVCGLVVLRFWVGHFALLLFFPHWCECSEFSHLFLPSVVMLGEQTRLVLGNLCVLRCHINLQAGFVTWAARGALHRSSSCVSTSQCIFGKLSFKGYKCSTCFHQIFCGIPMGVCLVLSRCWYPHISATFGSISFLAFGWGNRVLHSLHTWLPFTFTLKLQ